MKPQSKIASFFNILFTNFHELGLVQKTEQVVEKMNLSEKVFFYLVSVVVVISGLMLLMQVNNSFLVEVPSEGGDFTEGLVGSPRFINPALAISDTDKDLSSLIYSGLLKSSTGDGFDLDLAGSYEMSEDGLVYDFKIKENAYFHDGQKVTADDIIFTVAKILDPVVKSPKKSNWDGVVVEKVNDKEVKFILKKPYTPFLTALTTGILPKHIWEKISAEEFPWSDFNISPIGSGPYKLQKVTRGSGGIPTAITLSAFKKYAAGQPKIKTIVFKFFQNEAALMEAYDKKLIESVAGLSPLAGKNLGAQNVAPKTSLPRVFGVFFNQNIAPVFLNKEVREALSLSAPKKRIVDEVLYGFGQVLNGPTPANIERDPAQAEGNIEAARNLLTQNGWKENANGILEKKTKDGTTLLSFSIATSDAEELKKTAEILRETWTKIGAEVAVKIFEAGDLSQNVIKSRKYDALLFGEVIGKETDLFPFWHSSERNDPGLNISLYANITADKMLEEIQKETDGSKKASDKETLLAEIRKDIPAIFLFSPDLIYAPAPEIKNIILKDVSAQSERFLFVSDWFIETDKVWKIFASN